MRARGAAPDAGGPEFDERDQPCVAAQRPEPKRGPAMRCAASQGRRASGVPQYKLTHSQ